MSEIRARLDAAAQMVPAEYFPGYVAVEPVPLRGPDLATWTLRELLFMGQLVFNYEGTPFVEMVERWDRHGPLHEYLDAGNEHLLRLILSWKRIASKTPAELGFFPKFPLRVRLDRHYNFIYE